MNALEKLKNRIANGFHICVGLDTDVNKIPKHLLKYDDPVLNFNTQIIDATKELTCAYKINFAFYEKYGAEGFRIIESTLKYIPESVLTIADAKRGDIGNTSQMYAQSVFEHFGFDAITLHPYMGYDSLSPFLDYTDKLHFILALTSNPGNSDFEKLVINDGNYLFQHVIEKTKQWNKDNNCGIVFGATNKNELEENIHRFDDMPVLLPGVGAQGGSLEDVTSIFKNSNKKNFLVNVSRALLYCDSSEDFASSALTVLSDYNSVVNKFAD